MNATTGSLAPAALPVATIVRRLALFGVALGLTVVLQLAAVYVPLLQPLFRTAPLSAADLGLCVAGAAVVFGVVELEKLVRRRWLRPPAAPKTSTRQNAAS